MKLASFPENTFYLFNLHKCKCHRTAQPELQNFSQATFHKREREHLVLQSKDNNCKYAEIHFAHQLQIWANKVFFCKPHTLFFIPLKKIRIGVNSDWEGGPRWVACWRWLWQWWWLPRCTRCEWPRWRWMGRHTPVKRLWYFCQNRFFSS